MSKKFKPTDILIGIVFTLFFISLGLVFTINFRLLYYMDISILDIPKTSGLSAEVIIENYDALIDYCSPFFSGALKFPSLPASTEGLIHFEEVKNIFVSFYVIGIVSFVIGLVVILYKAKKKDKSYLRVSSITTLVLPIIVGGAIALNFDKAFVLFHKIFFRNDYWLFDPETDPIINILPAEYFMHCAIVIIVFVLLGSLALYLASNIGRKRSYERFKNKKFYE